MEKLHDVEYMMIDSPMGGFKVTAKMNQKDLGQLLLNDNVVLLSVNKPQGGYSPRRSKKKK